MNQRTTGLSTDSGICGQLWLRSCLRRSMLCNTQMERSICTVAHLPISPPPLLLKASVARRLKFRPKSSKGAVKKNLWPEELVVEFYQKWQKKGPEKVLKRNSLFYTNNKHSVRRQNLIFVSILFLYRPLGWTLHWCLNDIGRTFPKLAELFWFTGPGNIADRRSLEWGEWGKVYWNQS